MAELDAGWARERCLAWKGSNPSLALEALMDDDRCSAFGPIHHFLVGASLLACAHNAIGGRDGSALGAQLDELPARSSCVPGAACAEWGVCGASASAGMAFAILADNAPLKAAGWSEGQLMVADILTRISQAGSPRCCKRDSRIAVRAAVTWFNRYLDVDLQVSDHNPTCAVVDMNTACLGEACPYHPRA